MPAPTSTDRRPPTGAPIWNPNLPATAPLPPGQQQVEPNARHPVTHAPIHRFESWYVPVNWRYRPNIGIGFVSSGPTDAQRPLAPPWPIPPRFRDAAGLLII